MAGTNMESTMDPVILKSIIEVLACVCVACLLTFIINRQWLTRILEALDRWIWKLKGRN